MYKQLIVLLLISVAGLIFFIVLQNRLHSDNLQKRKDRLDNIHDNAVNQFTRSIDRFAYLMSGMRSHLNHSANFPNQEALQAFFAFQVDYLGFKDSLIVSFIDTDHVFRYSFSRNVINPGNLIGKSVVDLRDTVEINNLNNLLESDEMIFFDPINLIEGWVGIPMNFRVIREGKVEGYVASLINFRNIIYPVDQMVNTEEFILRFSVKSGKEFDREQVYDGSRVYHSRHDSLSFRNHDISIDHWLTSTINLYGQEFILSTAYRKPYQGNTYLSLVFIFLYVLIVTYTSVLIFKIRETKNLHVTLEGLHQITIEQNQELKALNKTKDRFFSIIGHDLRGPLGTVINLMDLIKSERISSSDLKTYMKQLFPAAKNTITLLENLLQWAQINNHEIRFNPSWVNITELMEETKGLIAANASFKRIHIQSSKHVEEKVWIDRDMIATIVRNLLLNAVKFSDSEDVIELNTYLLNEALVIEVLDQGSGMEESELEALENNSKNSVVGTHGETGFGLGLTISKAFVEAHKGSLQISSKKTVGSQFRVILPQKQLLPVE